jgi:hypothetical protein
MLISFFGGSLWFFYAVLLGLAWININNLKAVGIVKLKVLTDIEIQLPAEMPVIETIDNYEKERLRLY